MRMIGAGTEMDRRDFIKLFAFLVCAVIVPHSSQGKEVKKLLDNEDRPGFYIRFIKPIEPVDPLRWVLRVDGLCEKPRIFTLGELMKLPRVVQTSRLTCVEGWSSKATWGGFRTKELFELVKPNENARYLYLYSADGYYEYIPIDRLLENRVLFVYEMNKRPLPDVHGGPLRLIMPSKYGYKSVKTILRLAFVEKEGTGYWSKYGYPADATIQPGTDHALDLKTYKIIREPGEPDY